MGMPTATVRLRGPDGKVYTEAAVGTGPVHAAYTAIDGIVGWPVTLVEFAVNAVTEGIDALGQVTVRIQRANGSDQDVINPQSDTPMSRTFGGHGAETDIVVASVKAYMAALNKLLVAYGYGAREQETPAVAGVTQS
jgi:2-isopropylmalate synthase